MSQNELRDKLKEAIGWYMDAPARRLVHQVIAELDRIEAAQAVAPGGGEGVDAFRVMRSAFVTSESCGPDGDYRLVFRFPSLEALQQAHHEWVAPATQSTATVADCETRLDELVEEYEWRGDGGDYTPTDHERTLMADFAHGLFVDDDFVRLVRSAFSATPQSAPVDGAFERAMKASWEMVVPHPTWATGSYYAGQNNGMIAALKTVRENYERELAAMIAAAPASEAKGINGEALVERLEMLVVALKAEASVGRRGYNFGEDAANARAGSIAGEIEKAVHEVRVLGTSHPRTAEEAQRCKSASEPKLAASSAAGKS